MATERTRLRAGVLAGLAGGAAFAAAMRIDIAISRQPVDDFLLLGGVGPLKARWRVTGPLIHAANSAILGAVYALVGERLPLDGWRRGVIFALMENTLLWPLIVAIDRFHPAIRAGELPPFNRPWPFIAENLRHAAYGAALGWTYERLVRRSERVL